MRVRRVLRAVGAVLVLVGSVMVLGAPAGAADAKSIDDTGWWWRLNDGPLGAAVPPPGVSEGQLLVEGQASGASAIAAIRATLQEAHEDPVLTLAVGSAQGDADAVLLACQAGSGWTGTSGAGRWEEKPSPDCADAVTGVRADDGATWTFDLSDLQFEDQVNVVLTPGALDGSADGTGGSTFRIVFEGPDASSIQTSETPGGGELGGTEFDVAPPPDGGGTADSGDSDAEAGQQESTAAPAPGPSVSFSPPPTSPSSSASAALPAGEQGRTATAPILQSSTAPQQFVQPIADDSDGDNTRMIGLLVVLAGAAGLFWTSRVTVPDLQVLSRFAQAGAARHEAAAAVAHQEEATVGGLGRFRRPRAGPARSLGS